MQENKLKFCLVVDTEGFSMFDRFHPRWGVFDKIKFLINWAIKGFRYDKNGFYRIYRHIVKEKFPVSFMLVGSKFKPLSAHSFIDWGYHSFSHKRLTRLADRELDKEIENIYHCVSFNAPMWFIENPKNPKRIFEALKKKKYKISLYLGDDDKIMKMRHLYSILPVEKRHGLNIVYPSEVFNGGESEKKIDKIKKEILSNLGKNAVYCLVTHDFSHKNMRNFKNIIQFVKKLEKENKIKITNLKWLAG